jgi:hypothetical protein
MAKILCPFHEESTPSCEVYDDGFHCFGCGATGPLSALNRPDLVVAPRKPPANLADDLARITSLPRARVRGLDLPVDADSYYIVWPGNSFYKRRKFIPGEGPKYVCPRGHTKPLFVARETKGPTLAVVEGELNALSIAALEPSFSVCSPGGVGDFNERVLERDRRWFSKFSRFVLVLDKDGPGLAAAIKFKEMLLKRTPYVVVQLMSRDANELLMSGELTQEVQRWGA